MNCREFIKSSPLVVYFASAGLEALLCLGWLMSIPSDANTSLPGGFSVARLGMAGGLLFVFIICAVVFFITAIWFTHWNNLKNQLHDHPEVWKPLLATCVTIFLTGLVALVVPDTAWGDKRFAVARLKPWIAWVTLVTFQTSALIISQTNWHSVQIPQLDILHGFSLSPVRLAETRRSLLKIVAGAAITASIFIIGSQPLREIATALPPFLPLALFLGMFMLAAGLLPGLRLARLTALLFAVLLATGILGNSLHLRPESERANAQLRLLPEDTAVTLGQEYHYSLSLYHILSSQQSGSTIITTPELLRTWNLTETRLKEWGEVSEILYANYNPQLNRQETEALTLMDPLVVEINTSEGSRFYNLLSADDQQPVTLVLAYFENLRFLVPAEVFKELFPQKSIH